MPTSRPSGSVAKAIEIPLPARWSSARWNAIARSSRPVPDRRMAAIMVGRWA
jgi:hypothetical protein